MIVGQEEKALVLILQAHAVRQRPDVVPQVEFAGGAIPGEEPSFLHAEIPPFKSALTAASGCAPTPRSAHNPKSTRSVRASSRAAINSTASAPIARDS